MAVTGVHLTQTAIGIRQARVDPGPEAVARRSGNDGRRVVVAKGVVRVRRVPIW